MLNNYCVIMAGGIGSRFWPMSRNNNPKQFLDILGTGKTLIRQTYERFLSVCPPENIYIVTNETYLDHVFKQIPEMNKEQVLAEPQRRNTSPCVIYAAMKIINKNPDANLVIAPSDHIINDEKKFEEAITKGLSFTKEKDVLLTIGIKPDRPDTGYGYIQFKDENADEEFPIRKVKTFTEKPNLEMAKFFLKSGEFLWNAGIFIWNAKAIIHAFEEYLPDMFTIFNDGKQLYNSDSEPEFIREAYTLCKNISIDYGIMEKAKNVFVMSADFGWSDLGTWKSLYEHLAHDKNENAVVGQHVMLEHTSNCVITVPKNKLAVIQGMDDFIIVDTDNVLLICKKDDEQQVRNLVNDVKIKKGDRYV